MQGACVSSFLTIANLKSNFYWMLRVSPSWMSWFPESKEFTGAVSTHRNEITASSPDGGKGRGQRYSRELRAGTHRHGVMEMSEGGRLASPEDSHRKARRGVDTRSTDPQPPAGMQRRNWVKCNVGRVMPGAMWGSGAHPAAQPPSRSTCLRAPPAFWFLVLPPCLPVRGSPVTKGKGPGHMVPG